MCAVDMIIFRRNFLFFRQKDSMKRIRHVAVLIESSRAAGRGLIEGVARYSQECRSWSLYFEPRGLETALPRWLKNWKGDGILARLDHRQMADAAFASGVPVVDLRGALTDERFALIVRSDNERIVALAFDHLRGQGLQQFAFCGGSPGANQFLDQRRADFLELVGKSGFACDDFSSRRSGRRPPEWEHEIDQIAGWLKTLVKPVGVMACNDDRGYQVLEACRHAGLRVPDEIAVIGVDNDSVLCNMSVPPLSSVDPDAERGGFEAAAWLDRIMSGQKPPSEPITIEPRGLVARHSTDVLAIDDVDVVAAVRFIREQACAGIRVHDVLKRVPISQSELERRFKRYLGRTPKAELLRVQIAHARRLLVETDLLLSDVAKQSGFSNEKYFGDVFHRMTNVRPATYRRSNGRRMEEKGKLGETNK
jgi:LacI family transcriptional regulator